MGVGAFLLALVQPIISRILVALGMSIVTFTGMAVLMEQVTQAVQTAWGGLPGAILGLAGLAGLGEGLSIVFGAIATRVLIWQLTKSTRMLMSNPQ
jgi:Protein of unknown function (DUF2523).